MYEDSGYYDPVPSLGVDLDAAAAIGLDHHLGFVDIEPDNYQAMDVPPSADAAAAAAAWEHHLQTGDQAQYDAHVAAASYGAAPDLLNLLQLPRCGSGDGGGPVFPPPPASVSFHDVPMSNIWADDASMLYDPPPLHLGGGGSGYRGGSSGVLRDLYGSLPQSYGLFCGGGGAEERDVHGGGVGVLFQEFDGNVMEMGGGREVGKGHEGKGNFVTERQRRQQLNGKYAALRSLIPNPTKNDRASVVGDAIEYIKELLRTVEEFKIMVQKKKHGRERRRMLKSEDEQAHGGAPAAADMESSSMRPPAGDVVDRGGGGGDHPLNGALRSSWLQRRSKESFIDVRIVDDEANIKLNQKMKPNCLLHIARALEELQLDLVHASGGNIGDSYVFMLNTKICEGSSVYAGAIAKKLLEVMDRQCPSLAFTNNYN